MGVNVGGENGRARSGGALRTCPEAGFYCPYDGKPLEGFKEDVNMILHTQVFYLPEYKIHFFF